MARRKQLQGECEDAKQPVPDLLHVNRRPFASHTRRCITGHRSYIVQGSCILYTTDNRHHITSSPHHLTAATISSHHPITHFISTSGNMPRSSWRAVGAVALLTLLMRSARGGLTACLGPGAPLSYRGSNGAAEAGRLLTMRSTQD
jgi:hypothetical protein